MTNSNDPPPPFVAASDRNKQPILDQLQDLLPDDAQVLEIGSGWGQHAIHFCRAMPGLDWQPSDQAARIVELEEQLGAAALPGIRRPLTLDVLVDDWPAGPFDVVYSANTAHIMS